MGGMLRQYEAAWYVWSSRSKPVELRALRAQVGSRLRLVTGVWKSTGKPSIIFVLNKENDLTVYRCCWNKYNLLEFTVTFWSYICSTEFMCLWSISMLKGTPYSSKIGFPGGSVVKNLPANAGATGDVYSTPGSKRSPEEGNGNPFQYSCLENATDRGAWRGAVHGVTKNQTQLSIAHNYWKMENKWLGLTYPSGAIIIK